VQRTFGEVHEKLGEIEKAIEYYRKALKEDTLDNRIDWVSKLVGDSYTDLGLLAEAVKAYQQDI